MFTFFKNNKYIPRTRVLISRTRREHCLSTVRKQTKRSEGSRGEGAILAQLARPSLPESRPGVLNHPECRARCTCGEQRGRWKGNRYVTAENSAGAQPELQQVSPLCRGDCTLERSLWLKRALGWTRTREGISYVRLLIIMNMLKLEQNIHLLKVISSHKEIVLSIYSL